MINIDIGIDANPPGDLSILEEFELVHPEQLRWTLEDKISYLSDDDFIFLWAVDEFGYYMGEIILQRKGYGNDRKLYILSISVLEDYQRMGVGKALVKEAMHYGKEKRYRCLYGEAKQPMSISLFLKCGAEITGLSKNHGGTGLNYVKFVLML